MNKRVLLLAAVLLAACASTDNDPEPVYVPQPAPDPRIGEMQTQLTELLERIDVLNDRIARVEEGAVALTVPPSAPAPATRAAAEPRVVSSEPAAPSATPPGTQRAVLGAQIAENYRQAIMLFGRGRHADARRAFQEVLEADPSGDLADNALYWIGETYFAAGDLSNAVRHYNRVVNEFPDENKAPDALYKTALVQVRTGDLALARRTLQQVIDRYPYATTAASAKAELQRIRY